TADWIIDLGPEGGDGGGEIVAAGTPEDVAREKRSYTGAFLKPVLARRPAAAEGDRRGKGRGEAAEGTCFPAGIKRLQEFHRRLASKLITWTATLVQTL